MKTIDLTNKKFGKLTVIKQSNKKNSSGNIFWICKCDCGKETEVLNTNLTRNNTKSCGCLKKRHKNLNPTWKGYGDITGRRFYNFKKNAKQRNLIFEVTIEQLWNLFEKQNRKCALTGDEIIFSTNSENLASLDRIDNSKGYYIENIRWIRSDINMMKKDMSDLKLIKLCEKIVNYNH